ncbi:MAG: formate dehydrogenase accessory protein FdhE [Coriobacteriales bacterium]|jgi:FdhE protein|nr:formate dehydrogenase accessory protein FdhE [Coriobacteriales bacterium]
MDLHQIDSALEAYQQTLGTSDKARLEFFRGLWALQQASLTRLVERGGEGLPSTALLRECQEGRVPLLLLAPAVIDADELVVMLESCAAWVAANAGLAATSAEALKACDWRALVAKSDLALAGRDPGSWIEETEREAAFAQTASGQSAPFGIVLACALRPQLEAVALAAHDGLTQAASADEAAHGRPRALRCPVCGGSAAAGYVGPVPSRDGSGRMLYCALCGCSWEFERIRCACCGTHNQGKLHYFHIEGDSAHRLHLCDECGTYLRTTFVTELAMPFSFEVEDVVMARLDKLAHEERFSPQRKH